jgi:hypothetical protein
MLWPLDSNHRSEATKRILTCYAQYSPYFIYYYYFFFFMALPFVILDAFSSAIFRALL